MCRIGFSIGVASTDGVFPADGPATGSVSVAGHTSPSSEVGHGPAPQP